MLSRRSRLVAPFVVAGIIAAGAAVPTLGAAASPRLPAMSPQRLVVKVLDEKVAHLSGTVQWRADLGLPSLTELSGAGQSVASSSGFDPTSLLSGRHSFKIWIAGPGEQRIAAPGTLSETDAVRRGNQAWVYDSSTNHVTHYVVRGADSATEAAPDQGMDSVGVTQLAEMLLRNVRSSGTTVSVGRAVKVAGRAAYVLRLAPNRSIAANRTSTVAAVTIAVDAKTGLPLRVSVYAVGQSSAALQVGYSSISYAKPKASVFAAPKGQTTSTKTINAPASAHPGIVRRIAVHSSGAAVSASSTPAVAKQDWGTIDNVAPSSAGSGATARQLSSISTVVSGSWGSGRLVRSTLVNVLVLDNGRVLAGFVTPQALEAAAGHLSR